MITNRKVIKNIPPCPSIESENLDMLCFSKNSLTQIQSVFIPTAIYQGRDIKIVISNPFEILILFKNPSSLLKAKKTKTVKVGKTIATKPFESIPKPKQI